MQKLFIAIGGLAVIGIAYWLISPFFITRRVDEKLEDIMHAPGTPPAAVTVPAPMSAPAAPPADGPIPAPPTPALTTISTGTFTGLTGHSGRGTATLLKSGARYFVRFEDDFRVTNGPDLFVYFGQDGQYVAEARLAALKGNEGGQNYEVPAGVNPLDYTEVWVWCRAFSVPFAKAELR